MPQWWKMNLENMLTESKPLTKDYVLYDSIWQISKDLRKEAYESYM